VSAWVRAGSVCDRNDSASEIPQQTLKPAQGNLAAPSAELQAGAQLAPCVSAHHSNSPAALRVLPPFTWHRERVPRGKGRGFTHVPLPCRVLVPGCVRGQGLRLPRDMSLEKGHKALNSCSIKLWTNSAIRWVPSNALSRSDV